MLEKRNWVITGLICAFLISYLPAEATEESVTIAFGGDVHGEYPITKTLSSSKNILGGGAEIFAKADFAVVNLETAITRGVEKRDKKYNFKSDHSLLKKLKAAGVDLVSIGNNHSFDYGVNGFKDTLLNLQKENLLYVGGGKNAQEAYGYQQVILQDIKIGIIGLAMVNGGVGSIASLSQSGTSNGWDDKSSVAAVKRAKKDNDIVIVLAHWGAELARCPRESEIQRAKIWFEAGASMIIGTHPHVIQSMVADNNRVLAYSLGNLVFYASKEKAKESGVLEVTFNKKEILSTKFTPLKINGKTGIPESVGVLEYAKKMESFAKLNDCKGAAKAVR